MTGVHFYLGEPQWLRKIEFFAPILYALRYADWFCTEDRYGSYCTDSTALSSAL